MYTRMTACEGQGLWIKTPQGVVCTASAIKSVSAERLAAEELPAGKGKLSHVACNRASQNCYLHGSYAHRRIQEKVDLSNYFIGQIR